jgi:hypothetical protein
MGSMLNQQDYQSIGDRLGRIGQDAKPAWGKMNAAQMMWHCAVAVQNALGEKPATGTAPGFLKWPPVRWLIIHAFPLPKNSPTAPEFVAPEGADFLKAKADLVGALKRFHERPGEFAPSPAFGNLSREDYGALVYKHVDHHLRQFGA